MNRIRVFQTECFCYIFLIFTGFSLLNSGNCNAQIVITESGSHFQNFNTLSTSESDHEWIDNVTIPGWYWDCPTNSSTTYLSDNGTSPTVGRRCYGITNDPDRAIGGLCNKDNKPYVYGIKLYNNSTKNITNLSVGYTGEQWKVNSDRNAQQIVFYYQVTNSPLTTFTINSGWTSVTNLNFVSPKTGPLNLVLNGNDPSNRQIFNDFEIPGLVIPSGSYVLLRWYDNADTNGDHGLAIDDVTIKWTVGSSDPAIVWTGAQSTDWFDNRNWSPTTVPGADKGVEMVSVARKAICNNDISIKNLIIRNGGQLTINPGKTITVSENSVFEGTNCLILKSPTTLKQNPPYDHDAAASFLCNGTVSGQGSIKVERYISNYISDTDGWHFFSSPVNNPTIGSQFLPDIFDDLYFYEETSDKWLDQKTVANNITNFVNGLGYLLSYSDTATRFVSGLPNSSDFKFPNLSYTGNRGWHLLGNPYPCGLSWGNTNWAINNISYVAKLLNSGGTYSDLSIGETIPAMNGFFVKVNSSDNTITIPKAARLHSIASGWKRSKSNTVKKIKLTTGSISNNTYAESNIVLNADATMGYDLNFDSPYLSGMPGTPLFYSVLSNGQELSTNCVPDAASMVFNFQFTPGLARDYTLTADITEDWVTAAKFILEDKKMNIKHTLINGSSFTFTSDATDPIDRFKLGIDIVTGIKPFEGVDSLSVTSLNRQLFISVPNKMKSGQIIINDLLGRQILSRVMKTVSMDFRLPKGGFYLVSFLFNNQRLSRKIYIP